MAIIRTHEKNVETVQYGEMLGQDLKTIFTYELKHHILNDIEDDDTREVEVKTIAFDNYYILIISFDGTMVLEEKKKHGMSSHMNMLLTHFEDCSEEEEEEDDEEDNDEEDEDRPECEVCCNVYDEDGGCECVVCKSCEEKHSHYAELCEKCCMCNGIDKGSSPFNIKCCEC
jgi:hypothetical protein